MFLLKMSAFMCLGKCLVHKLDEYEKYSYIVLPICNLKNVLVGFLVSFACVETN